MTINIVPAAISAHVPPDGVTVRPERRAPLAAPATVHISRAGAASSRTASNALTANAATIVPASTRRTKHSVAVRQIAPSAKRAKEQHRENSEQRQRRDQSSLRHVRHPIAAGPGIGSHSVVGNRPVVARCESHITHRPVARPDSKERVRRRHAQTVLILRDATTSAALAVVDHSASRIEIRGVALPIQVIRQHGGEDGSNRHREQQAGESPADFWRAPILTRREYRQSEHDHRSGHRQPRGPRSRKHQRRRDESPPHRPEQRANGTARRHRAPDERRQTDGRDVRDGVAVSKSPAGRAVQAEIVGVDSICLRQRGDRRAHCGRRHRHDEEPVRSGRSNFSGTPENQRARNAESQRSLREPVIGGEHRRRSAPEEKQNEQRVCKIVADRCGAGG